MKKEKFGFVKYLTKSDVKKILKQCGYEINEELPSPYSKFKDENGNYYIIVKCTKTLFNENEYMVKKIENIIFKHNSLIANNISNSTVLDFSDFTLTEFFASFNEEENIKNNQYLTQIYHKYMQEKFGKFYNQMKKKYIKALEKQNNEKEENV